MAVSNKLGLYLPSREDYMSVTRDISDNFKAVDAAAGGVAIIINGNTASVSVTTGQYVTVINSTIVGIVDGLYKATANVSAGTSFVASNLTEVQNGLGGEIFSVSNAFNGFIHTNIVSNTNLNSLTTMGFYDCINSATSATLVNSPVTSAGFSMIVMQKGSYVSQIIFPGNANIFSRTLTSSGWTEWYKFTGAAV